MDLNGTSPTAKLSHPATAAKHYPQDALIFHTILLVLGTLIIINNVTVISIYRKCKDLRNWTNFLLICLAASDTLAGCLNIPFIVASSVLAFMKSGSYIIHFTSNAVTDFVITSNVLLLFLIFTERYLSICRPILSRNFITFEKIRNCVMMIWASAFVLAIVPLAWSYEVIANRQRSAAYIKRMMRLSENHSLFVSICCFIVPSVLILFYTVAVLRMVFYVSSDYDQRKKVADRRRAFCLLLVMFVLLLLTWSPLITVRIIMDTNKNIRFSKVTLEVIVTLRFLTSFFNPLIYTLFKEDFKKAFFGLLDICKAPMPQESLIDDNL